MAGTKINPVVLSTIALGLAWAAILANDSVNWVGVSLSLHSTLLHILGVTTVLVGVAWINHGPASYRAMRVGEAIGEARARRHERSGERRHMGVITR